MFFTCHTWVRESSLGRAELWQMWEIKFISAPHLFFKPLRSHNGLQRTLTRFWVNTNTLQSAGIYHTSPVWRWNWLWFSIDFWLKLRSAGVKHSHFHCVFRRARCLNWIKMPLNLISRTKMYLTTEHTFVFYCSFTVWNVSKQKANKTTEMTSN